MNTSSLTGKFADKNFLKKNDLADALTGFFHEARHYKLPILAALLVLLILLIGIPVHRFLDQRESDALAVELFQVEELPATNQAEIAARIAGFQALVKEYATVPAVRLAEVKFATFLLENNKTDEALSVVDAGLKLSSTPDILSTLLVLKKASLFKSQGKLTEAIQVLDASNHLLLASFADSTKLIKASWLLLTGKKEEARVLYEQLSTLSLQGADKSVNLLESFDPTVSNRAREQLLLMELGQL